MNIYFNDAMRTIDDNDYFNVCKRFRNRIIAILYLKESLNKQEIKEYDITSYIQTLQSDLFGAYETFRESKFLSGMCELEGIRHNLNENYIRKKILDLANFINNLNRE